MNRWMTLFGAVCMLAGIAATVSARAEEAAKPAPPNVLGAWTGTWGPYMSPAAGSDAAGAYAKYCKAMDCKIERADDGKWQATFQGECGRPYKYTIHMTGEQAGVAVMFKGSADLGEKDGGVYDWIGRADEKGFVGFYTSKGHVGTFTLARPGELPQRIRARPS